MDGEGGAVIFLFVILSVIIGLVVGFIVLLARIVEIISGFITSYSTWFYGLGGLLVFYSLFLQVKAQKQTLEKEHINRLSKSLNTQFDQSQQQLNQQWRDWES